MGKAWPEGFPPDVPCIYWSSHIATENRLLARSLMNMLNRTGPSTDPWGTPPVTGLQPDSARLIMTLGVLILSEFCVHLTVPSSNPHFLSLPVRMLWETVSNALLKSRQTTSTALPSSTQPVTPAQKAVSQEPCGWWRSGQPCPRDQPCRQQPQECMPGHELTQEMEPGETLPMHVPKIAPLLHKVNNQTALTASKPGYIYT
ncbi:uncharacterized protein LOC135316058 [Phalacrocorax carbo]|uniref:uncharacterized protein LOC135316058 n=1 Tax=Phalacrocorax carbo TaxID=9209 RepID=UPI00311A4007